jgi:ACS family tartrate transporter-like MFS transporter
MTRSQAALAPPLSDALSRRQTLAKVGRRLLPFTFVLYVVNYLDRTNVSFAALGMNRDLGFSATTYGLGAGLFFLGYIPCQVPANLLLVRVGTRRWIRGVMITWGVVAGAMALIRGVTEFYVLRALLGVAEAGFLPGMLVYLGDWFPSRERARAVALFMIAIPISSIVGGPISGALLGLGGLGGIAGWRWLFVLEAIPAIVLGLVASRPHGPPGGCPVARARRARVAG